VTETIWDSDGSESRLCFPHDADVDAVLMRGKYRYILADGEEGAWEECCNFIKSGATGDIVKHRTAISAYNEKDWVAIEMSIEIFIEDPAGHISTVMHESDEQYFGTLGVNLLSSSGAKYQSRSREWFGGTSGELCCTLELNIKKEDHAGNLVLEPRAFLSKHLGDGLLNGKARRIGSILGTGFPIEIHLDVPRSIPGGSIKHRWTKFGPEHARALTHLVVEGGEITCFWNNAFEPLRVVIDSTNKTGKRAAMRDAIFAPKRVELVEMLTHWAAQNDIEDEDGPESQLARRILKRVCKWVGGTPSTLKEMYGGGDVGQSDLIRIWEFNRTLQQKFSVGKAIDNMYTEVNE